MDSSKAQIPIIRATPNSYSLTDLVTPRHRAERLVAFVARAMGETTDRALLRLDNDFFVPFFAGHWEARTMMEAAAVYVRGWESEFKKELAHE